MDFFKFGRGRKTLVILPGLSVQSVMLSADAIEKAYCSLENDFTIYVFDRRKELPPVYSIDDMANDTAEAMSAAGIGWRRRSAHRVQCAQNASLSLPSRRGGG